MRVAVLVLATVLAIPLRAQEKPQAPVYEVGKGVTAPVLVHDVKPTYTAGAMREKVEGRVRMRAVVRTDGRVEQVEVITSLHAELDQQAVMALRQWKFTPGTREGKPVAVRITCDMTFSLKEPKRRVRRSRLNGCGADNADFTTRLSRRSGRCAAG